MVQIKKKQPLGVLLTIWVSSLFSGPLAAQVMDIGPDGRIATYRGPVVTFLEGVQPLNQRTRVVSSPAVSVALRSAALRHHISQDLVSSVAWQESNMQQSAVSPRGARGVMQLMPATSRDLKVEAADLTANVDGGAAYLAQLLARFDGDVIKSLAAYNAGPEAVRRYGGIPPYAQTRAYVSAVLERLAGIAKGDTP